MLEQKILEQLKNNDLSLTHLELKNPSKEELLTLEKILKNNTTLQSLDLTNCYLRQEYTAILARLFSKIKSLNVTSKSCSVWQNNEQAEILCDALQNNRSMQNLSFTRYYFYDEATRVLEAFLMKHPTLLSLTFDDCEFSQGLYFLQKVLEKNTYLKHLHLYALKYPFLSDGIIPALKESNSLLTFDCRDCGLNLDELASVLAVNRSLRYVNLNITKGFTLSDLFKLERALSKNYILERLNIEPFTVMPPKPFSDFNFGEGFDTAYTKIGEKTKAAIDQIVSRNAKLHGLVRPFFEDLRAGHLYAKDITTVVRSFSQLMPKNTDPENDFYIETWRLLCGLLHFSYDNFDLALHYLLPPFTQGELANFASEYSRQALFLIDTFNDESSLLLKYQWIAYCSTRDFTDPLFLSALVSVYFRKPALMDQLIPAKIMRELVKADYLLSYKDIKSIVEKGLIAFAQKQENEKKIVNDIKQATNSINEICQNWDQASCRLSLETKSHQALPLSRYLISPLQEALELLISDDWRNQKKCLESFLSSPCCSPEALNILLKSEVFVEQLQSQYPNVRTFRLFEDYLLNPNQTELGVNIFALPASEAIGPMSAQHVETYIKIASQYSADSFYDPLRKVRNTLISMFDLSPKVKKQCEQINQLDTEFQKIPCHSDEGKELNSIISNLQQAYNRQVGFKEEGGRWGFIMRPIIAGEKWNIWGAAVNADKKFLKDRVEQLEDNQESVVRSALKTLVKYLDFTSLEEALELITTDYPDSYQSFLFLKFLCLTTKMTCEEASKEMSLEAKQSFLVDKGLLNTRIDLISHVLNYCAKISKVGGLNLKSPLTNFWSTYSGSPILNAVNEKVISIALKKLIENTTLPTISDALAQFKEEVPNILMDKKWGATFTRLFNQLRYEDQCFYGTLQEEDMQNFPCMKL